jgi:hypothetical protein
MLQAMAGARLIKPEALPLPSFALIDVEARRALAVILAGLDVDAIYEGHPNLDYFLQLPRERDRDQATDRRIRLHDAAPTLEYLGEFGARRLVPQVEEEPVEPALALEVRHTSFASTVAAAHGRGNSEGVRTSTDVDFAPHSGSPLGMTVPSRNGPTSSSYLVQSIRISPLAYEYAGGAMVPPCVLMRCCSAAVA